MRKKRTPGRRRVTPLDPELQAMYDQIRRDFTAGDLQKFTETDQGVPAEEVVTDMEKIHRKVTRKRA